MGLPATLLTRVARNRSVVVAGRAQRPDPSSPPSRAAPDLEMGIRRTKSGATTGFPCIVAAACAEDRRDVALLLAWSPTNLCFPDDVLFARGCSMTPTGTRTLARARACTRPY